MTHSQAQHNSQVNHSMFRARTFSFTPRRTTTFSNASSRLSISSAYPPSSSGISCTKTMKPSQKYKGVKSFHALEWAISLIFTKDVSL